MMSAKIESLLESFHERLTRLEMPAGLCAQLRNEPFSIKCGTSPDAGPSAGAGWGVTSYNILSLDMAMDGHYLNLDGTPKSIDVEARRQAINRKVVGWMEQGQIICLQEATLAYVSGECNPVLHAALRLHGYDVYHHQYQWTIKKDLPAKGYFSLGLAVLVPSRLYTVAEAGLLWPWKDPVMPPDDQAAAARLDKERGRLGSLVAVLSRAVPNASLFQKTAGECGLAAPTTEALIACLRGREAAAAASLEALRKRFVTVTEGPFKERTIIALRLEDRVGNALVVGNVHLPCKYGDGVMMASLALRAKQALLDFISKGMGMLLCGDFNAVSGSSAYTCLTGELDYGSCWTDKNIRPDDFERCVSLERWCAVGGDGCTVFGFTRTGFAAAKDEFLRFMALQGEDDAAEALEVVLGSRTVAECMAHRLSNASPEYFTAALGAKRDLFRPRQLCLDHFFTRFAGTAKHTAEQQPNTSQTTARVGSFGYTDSTQLRLEGRPIPDLGVGEPSDHLPIHLTLRFD
jgi:hypothetical protein